MFHDCVLQNWRHLLSGWLLFYMWSLHGLSSSFSWYVGFHARMVGFSSRAPCWTLTESLSFHCHNNLGSVSRYLAALSLNGIGFKICWSLLNLCFKVTNKPHSAPTKITKVRVPINHHKPLIHRFWPSPRSITKPLTGPDKYIKNKLTLTKWNQQTHIF